MSAAEQEEQEQEEQEQEEQAPVACGSWEEVPRVFASLRIGDRVRCAKAIMCDCSVVGASFFVVALQETNASRLVVLKESYEDAYVPEEYAPEGPELDFSDLAEEDLAVIALVVEDSKFKWKESGPFYECVVEVFVDEARHAQLVELFGAMKKRVEVESEKGVAEYAQAVREFVQAGFFPEVARAERGGVSIQ